MSLSRQTLLRLTDEQKKMLADLQKRVDERLAQILDADQRSRFESLKREFARGGLGPDGTGGPPGAGPGRADAAPKLPPGKNPVFRALRYGPDLSGMSVKDRRPGG